MQIPHDTGLGWGVDSIVGDHANSGAGVAEQLDTDSLLDLDTFEDPLKPELELYAQVRGAADAESHGKLGHLILLYCNCLLLSVTPSLVAVKCRCVSCMLLY